MAKFRAKPVEVDALRWDGDADTANSFLGEGYGADWEFAALVDGIFVSTRHGRDLARVGDWLVKDGGNGLSVLTDAAFTAAYDPA